MTTAPDPSTDRPTGSPSDRPTTSRPASVMHVVRALMALVVVTGLGTILVWVRQDEVVRTWAEGNVAARKLLLEGGVQAVQDSPIVPSFVPLAIVFFVVFVLLVLVLLAFFVEGHEWARLSLAAVAVFGILGAAVVLRLGLPALFAVVSVVSIMLCLLVLFLLWRPATNRWFREI